MRIGTGIVVAALLAGCSSSGPPASRSPIRPASCHAATADQIRRINDSGSGSGAVITGVTVAIPNDAGFDALVAARISTYGGRVGVWLIGSGGGSVIGVNPAARQQNQFTPNAGSLVGTYVREVTDGRQFRAVLACLSAR